VETGVFQKSADKPAWQHYGDLCLFYRASVKLKLSTGLLTVTHAYQ